MQSNDVNVNETSDESNSDAAESGVYQVNDQSTFEDALNKIASDIRDQTCPKRRLVFCGADPRLRFGFRHC